MGIGFAASLVLAAAPLLSVALVPSPVPAAADDLHCEDTVAQAAPSLRHSVGLIPAGTDGAADLAAALAQGSLGPVAGKWQTSLFQGLWFSQYCLRSDGGGVYRGFNTASDEVCMGNLAVRLEGDALVVQEEDGDCRSGGSMWTGMIVTCTAPGGTLACTLWDDKGTDAIGLSRVP